MKNSNLILLAALALLTPSLGFAETVLVVDDNTSFDETAQVGGTFIITGTGAGSTGTGVVDPFLRLQANGDEAGYNTGDNNYLNVKDSEVLTVGDLQAITFAGDPNTYYAFALDVNQQGNIDYVSLNQVQIFLSSAPATPGSAGYVAPTTGPPAGPSGDTNASFSQGGLTLIFQMSDTNAGNADSYNVQVNFNNGSGSGDMFLYVNASLFGSDMTKYVTLFSHLGEPPSGHIATNDGFEEWYAIKRASAVPLPSSLALLASGCATFGGLWTVRRRRAVRSQTGA